MSGSRCGSGAELTRSFVLLDDLLFLPFGLLLRPDLLSLRDATDDLLPPFAVRFLPGWNNNTINDTHKDRVARGIANSKNKQFSTLFTDDDDDRLPFPFAGFVSIGLGTNWVCPVTSNVSELSIIINVKLNH